jgi:hypothetical protein
MQVQIPYFKYRTKDPSNKHLGCIVLAGEVIHKIEDLNEFHKALGYTRDIAKAGMLPDEFIWDRYIRDAAKNCKICFQLHIIEYLLKHSASFRKKYEGQCEDWMAAHAEASSTCGGIVCPACKAKYSARSDACLQEQDFQQRVPLTAQG